jgi:hypothetical protein
MKPMTPASKHLATPRRGHARATTPRGTCTAEVGLDVETFCGFQLAGELFLLTSSPETQSGLVLAACVPLLIPTHSLRAAVKW